jgi:hypothetical protein
VCATKRETERQTDRERKRDTGRYTWRKQSNNSFSAFVIPWMRLVLMDAQLLDRHAKSNKVAVPH